MTIEAYPNPNGVLTSLIWRKTAAGGETSLSGYDDASQALSYTPGQEQVYLNGILLVRGDDYTATNGTSITGLTALTASDYIQVNCYNNFSVASVPTTSLTGTVSNAQLANSAITINGTSTSLGGTYTNASASTSTAGIVQLTDSTSSTSTSTAATPNSVKTAYDLANAAVPKSTATTKGDIFTATASSTPTRLGVGTDNYLLVSDSTQTTGLKWTDTITAGVLVAPEERWTVSATAATGTVNFDADTQGVLYYTTNASATWTLNVRGSTSTTLSSKLAVGDACTIAFVVTQGSSGASYYQTALTIDGNAQTVKWSGGTAPSAGNASATDIYQFTIIKTASTPTYTVLGAGPVKYS